MLTWGIFAGAILMFASLGALGRREPRWMNRYFRPWHKNGEAGFVRRAKLALSPWNRLFVLPLFSPALALGGALLYTNIFQFGPPVDLLLGGLVGYGAAAAAAFAFDPTKTLTSYRKQVAIFAAQKLVRRVAPAVSNAILVPLSKASDPGLRVAAAMGLRELGTKEGGEMLQLLGTDQDATVAAAARDAYNDLHQVYQGKGLLSVRTMDTYASEHAYLARQTRKKKKSRQYALDIEKLQEITRQIDEIVFSQLPLRRAFPDVYCQNCYARGEHIHYEEWDWVRCRQCREVHHLRPHVKVVIGQVGGDVEWELKEGNLRVSLWDEATRKARAADLDVLEIVGGKEIHYDWAVSAIVDRMEHHSLGVGTRIAVKLVNNPTLEANSQHLLKMLDQSIVPAYTMQDQA